MYTVYIINLCFCLPQTFYILPVEKISTLPWQLFCSQLLGVSKFDALPATKIHWMCFAGRMGSVAQPRSKRVYRTSVSTERKQSALKSPCFFFLPPPAVRSCKQMIFPKGLLKENMKCSETGFRLVSRKPCKLAGCSRWPYLKALRNCKSNCLVLEPGALLPLSQERSCCCPAAVPSAEHQTKTTNRTSQPNTHNQNNQHRSHRAKQLRLMQTDIHKKK